MHTWACRFACGRPLTSVTSLVGSLCIGVLYAPQIRAQVQTGSPPAFEVASIKLVPLPELDLRKRNSQGPGVSGSGGRVTVSATSVGSLIRVAYNVRNYQLVGGPNWVSDDAYDILAKAEGDSALSVDQVRQLIQTLLADRFHLRLHREMKEMSVYALVVDKDGQKLKEGTGDQFSMSVIRHPGQTLLTVLKGAMTQLAATLSSEVGRPVLDMTGLKGGYDFQLSFAPERSQADANPPDSASAPSIFTAVREQLGLRLDSTKGLVDVLMIDHVERPSEN